MATIYSFWKNKINMFSINQEKENNCELHHKSIKPMYGNLRSAAYFLTKFV